MKRIDFNQWARYAITCLFLLTGLGITPQAWSQNSKVKISGTVYELDGKKSLPLGYATVAIPDMALGTTSNENGKYELDGVPAGKVRLSIQFVGKVTIDTLVNATKDLNLNFTLKNESFKLKEVTVTATNSRTGKSTASHISRTAMDHMQATSLYDIMALMPGGISENQDMSKAQQINIRQLSNSTGPEAPMNALGTAVIRDGAPISNNANMSAMSASVLGSSDATPGALGGGASPAGGTDVRSISTENIESVQIIRGIPSVEYGDLTSGAVIINTKAGREPIRVKAKANPNIYQVSMGTGFELGGKKGALNVSADYAYNTSQPTASYQTYQRATAKVLYSNNFFNSKLRTNTSLDFIYGLDQRKLNPDDEQTKTSSEGRDAGITLNTNGTWNINKGWLKTIKYVLSGTYTDKQSFYQTIYSSASSPYSMTYTDGAILSNVAGKHVLDADGKEITNFSGADASSYAYWLPSSYLGRRDIDSREVNLFAKLTATLFKQSGDVNNRILIGADFRSDGNVGNGSTFDQKTPPYRSVYGHNSSFRPRSYKDIPFVNQVGAYIEDNFKWSIGGTHDFNLQAGVRYDHASVVGGIVSPRFNASLDIIPNVFAIQGGYGIAAKMPSLLYLYPEDAYFEYVNMNELMNENIPADERLLITTTKVHKIDNSDLKIARNHKAEIGFNLQLGKSRLNVTAYQERLKNGYALGQTFDTFHPFMYNEYTRNANGEVILASANSVLSTYAKPTNNLNLETKGVEFDLNIGRIDAIRTAFQLNGSWMRTKSWRDGYDFYDDSGDNGADRKPIAVYSQEGNASYRQQFVTTLRATHNIPRIGFVVTMTAQAVWNQSNWNTYGNDSIPVGYLSLEDAKFNQFEEGKYTTQDQLKADGYSYMIQNLSHNDAIKESYSPYFCFNLNVTKEISDMLRVSFFANNMFRSYPRRESKRNPGDFTVMNNRYFFGLELSLTL